MLAAACTGETPDDAADEVGTESESSESESSSSESGSSEVTESESDSTDEELTADTEAATEETTDTGETTDDTTETEESTTEESTTEESTTEEPTTDTGVETCMDIVSTYEALVETNTNCNVDADCHVLDGHCEFGLGGCWYLVNQNVQQSDLEDLLDAFQGMACPPLMNCLCLPPPNDAICVDGTCAPN
jgi:hypothetical protein